MTDMVDYLVPAPDGKKYPIKGPPGATPEQQLAAVLKRVPEAATPAEPDVPDETRTNNAPAMAPGAPASSGVPANQLRYKPEDSVANVAGLIPGIPEAAASTISGAVAPLLGGLGYLMKGAMTGSNAEAKAAQQDIQDTATYQPKSDTGKLLMQGVGAPFGAVTKLAEYAGEKLADSGHPAVGAAVNAGIQGLPYATGLRGMMERGGEPQPLQADNGPTPPPTPSPGQVPGMRTPSAGPEGPIPQPPAPVQPAPAAPAGPAPGNRTIRAILEQAKKDGLTIDQMRDRLQAAIAIGKPQSIAAVADAGGNVQGLARTMKTIPGENRKIAVSATDAAVTDMPDRVAGDIDQMAGAQGIDTEAAQAASEGKMHAEAAPAYERAYAQGTLDDPDLHGILEDNQAYADAHRQAMNTINKSSPKSEQVPSLFDDEGKLTRAPTVQDIDVIKKGMDSKIYGASGAAMDTASAFEKMGLHPLGKARDLLMQAVDKMAPDYAKARAQFGSSLEIQHAFEDGRNVVMKGESASPFTARQQLAQLSDAGKAAFRAGVQDSLRRRVYATADKSPAGVASEVAGTGQGIRPQMIRAIFGDTPATRRMLAQMKAEQARQQLRNQVQGGSNTMDKGADVADHVAEAATHSHSVTAMINHGVGKVVNAVRGAVDQTHRTSVATELFKTRTDLDTDPFFRKLQEAARRREARAGDTGMEF